MNAIKLLSVLTIVAICGSSMYCLSDNAYASTINSYETLDIDLTVGEDISSNLNSVIIISGASSTEVSTCSCTFISGDLPPGMSFSDASSSGRNSKGYYGNAAFKLNRAAESAGVYSFIVEGVVGAEKIQSTVTVTVSRIMTFDTEGSDTSNFTMSFTSYLTLPSPGTKNGYVFDGWYTSYSGGLRVGGIGDVYSPSSETTLYAHWSMATINITSASGATDMVQGKTYSHTVTADVSGCTVTVSGASWLTVSGYTISGVPPTAGDYNVTVTLSKTGYTSASQSFTIHVAEVLSFTSSPSAGIIISG